MEEPSSHGATTNGESSNSARPVDCNAVSEEGGNGDEPPIPSASSSRHLTEKSEGESRFDTTTLYLQYDADKANAQAHVLTYNEVLTLLETNSMYATCRGM